jgi:Ca-activated chloride channel family protein
MNHDDKNPELQTWIEPELEARLVASVLGETSAFEAAELERLIGEKPELGIFKRRIEAVHGLVGTAVRPEQAPLRLAPERRAKILETIGASAPRPDNPSTGANNPVLLELAAVRRKRRKKWIWGSGVAASLAFAVVSVSLLNSSGDYRERQERRATAPSVVNMVEMPRVEGEAKDAREADVITLSPFQVSQPSLTDKLRKALTGPAPEPPAISDFVGGRADIRHEGIITGMAASRVLNEQQANWSAKEAPETYIRGLPNARDKATTFEAKQKIASLNSAKPSPSLAGASGAGQNAPLQFFERAKDAEKKGFDALSSQLKSEAPPAAPAVEGETILMSPFEVSASADRGYAASNSMAGSRINVTTAMRLTDFASSSSSRKRDANSAAVDINDRFADDGFLFGGKTQAAQDFSQVNAAAPGSSAASIDEQLSQQKAAATPATPPAEAPRGEISAAKEPVSTFSLHVSDVSFRLAQAALARGETPDPTRIRPEEFYNAFDYGDPSPTTGDKVGCRIEQAAHPLLQQRNLVRIAMKVPAAGRGAGQPLHLTVLLDTSGSMEREDRIASVHRALDVLASLLGANDRVTLIGFARQPRLLAEHLSGDQAAKLTELASKTPFTGGTNLEEALKLAGELAKRHQNPAAQNRVVLITDGAANLGNADPAQLATMIEALRQQGIAFDVCGVGTDGLDDSVLEALTRKGDGRYYVLDKAEDADAGFARQLAGAFRPAAENVKVQVRFNPARVGSYRLIGFEQHRLREEDFRNDKVDAAELAAEEAAVAVYQVEVLPQGEGELGEVFVRFHDPAANAMVERSWTILHDAQLRAFDRATPTIQLAGVAALLAEKLRGDDAAKLIELAELAPVVNSLRGHYANDARVQQLITMYEQLRRREGR